MSDRCMRQAFEFWHLGSVPVAILSPSSNQHVRGWRGRFAVHRLRGDPPLRYPDEQRVVEVPGQHLLDTSLPECCKAIQFVL